MAENVQILVWLHGNNPTNMIFCFNFFPKRKLNNCFFPNVRRSDRFHRCWCWACEDEDIYIYIYIELTSDVREWVNENMIDVWRGFTCSLEWNHVIYSSHGVLYAYLNFTRETWLNNWTCENCGVSWKFISHGLKRWWWGMIMIVVEMCLMNKEYTRKIYLRPQATWRRALF